MQYFTDEKAETKTKTFFGQKEKKTSTEIPAETKSSSGQWFFSGQRFFSGQQENNKSFQLRFRCFVVVEIKGILEHLPVNCFSKSPIRFFWFEVFLL